MFEFVAVRVCAGKQGEEGEEGLHKQLYALHIVKASAPAVKAERL
jgi:hypothetical protein